MFEDGESKLPTSPGVVAGECGNDRGVGKGYARCSDEGQNLCMTFLFLSFFFLLSCGYDLLFGCEDMCGCSGVDLRIAVADPFGSDACLKGVVYSPSHSHR